jgi:hypothetical protein
MNFPQGLRRCAAVLLMCSALPAGAHSGGASYVDLGSDGRDWLAQIDLPVPDAVAELGLDRDGDGALRWAEVLDAQASMVERLSRRLRLAQDGQDCTPQTLGSPELVRRATGPHLRIGLRFACPATGAGALDAGGWLAEVPDHGVYVRRTDGSSFALLTLGSTTMPLAAGSGAAAPQTLLRFVLLGVEHLLAGYDHLAFLALLLLGAVRSRSGDGAGGSLALECLKPVTAFTAAHSLTLALAATGALSLPGAAVEAAIAASIVATAAAMLIWRDWAAGWRLAFGFGLVHGMGFASVLSGALAGAELAVPLFGFNLGLELAQLAVLVAALPLLAWLARRPAWGRVLAPACQASLALLGTAWLWQRL